MQLKNVSALAIMIMDHRTGNELSDWPSGLHHRRVFHFCNDPTIEICIVHVAFLNVIFHYKFV